MSQQPQITKLSRMIFEFGDDSLKVSFSTTSKDEVRSHNIDLTKDITTTFSLGDSGKTITFADYYRAYYAATESQRDDAVLKFILDTAKTHIQHVCTTRQAKLNTITDILAQVDCQLFTDGGEIDHKFAAQFKRVTPTVFTTATSVTAQFTPQTAQEPATLDETSLANLFGPTITHVPMAKGPGGTKLNELQALALDEHSKSRPGVVAIDHGSKSAKLIFTYTIKDITHIAVVDTKKITKLQTPYSQVLSDKDSEEKLAAFYHAAQAHIAAFCEKKKAVQSSVTTVIAQAGGIFKEGNEPLEGFNRNAIKCLQEIYRVEPTVQAEPQGLAGLQRTQVWWGCQSEEKRQEICEAAKSGVVIFWSGRMVSAVDPTELAKGRFNYKNQSNPTYAQCEGVTRMIERAITATATRLPVGAFIVVEPGASNPGFTVVTPEHRVFAHWDPTGDGTYIRKLEAEHGRTLKILVEIAPRDSEGNITDFRQIHETAAVLARDSYAAFIKTPEPQITKASAKSTLHMFREMVLNYNAPRPAAAVDGGGGGAGQPLTTSHAAAATAAGSPLTAGITGKAGGNQPAAGAKKIRR